MEAWVCPQKQRSQMKRTVYEKADLYHSEYLMNMKKPPRGAALGIGMNYIRFAIEEPHLFRFLFQSDYFSGKTLLELIDAQELLPVLSAMQKALDMRLDGFPVCPRVCQHHRQQCAEI